MFLLLFNEYKCSGFNDKGTSFSLNFCQFLPNINVSAKSSAIV